MKQYGWFNYNQDNDEFYRTNGTEMLKKCPRIMTKKVNTTQITKFSKITDDKI